MHRVYVCMRSFGFVCAFFSWYIENTMYNRSVHVETFAMTLHLVMLRLLRQREYNPQFSGHWKHFNDILVSHCR